MENINSSQLAKPCMYIFWKRFIEKYNLFSIVSFLAETLIFFYVDCLEQLWYKKHHYYVNVVVGQEALHNDI